MAVLREDGWLVAMTCQVAPVQIEGALPSGEPFYFRARFDGVTLDVGTDDPADPSHWSGEEIHPDASYLPAVKGLEILQRLYERYESRA